MAAAAATSSGGSSLKQPGTAAGGGKRQPDKSGRVTTFEEPERQSNQRQPRDRNKHQIERSPGGNNEVIKGQLNTQAPEAMSKQKSKARTRADRENDIKGGMSAEQRRLNPMAAEESKAGSGGMTAEQRRLNPMAAANGKAIAQKVTQ